MIGVDLQNMQQGSLHCDYIARLLVILLLVYNFHQFIISNIISINLVQLLVSYHAAELYIACASGT